MHAARLYSVNRIDDELDNQTNRRTNSKKADRKLYRRELHQGCGKYSLSSRRHLRSIPASKRISQGRYTTIKVLSEKLFEALENANLPVVEIGATILNATADPRTMGVGLGILALQGIKRYRIVLPYFESAARADNWELREYAQGLFRKIVKAHPVAMQPYLLKYAHSADPNLRRFVSETLRPVAKINGCTLISSIRSLY